MSALIKVTKDPQGVISSDEALAFILLDHLAALVTGDHIFLLQTPALVLQDTSLSWFSLPRWLLFHSLDCWTLPLFSALDALMSQVRPPRHLH